MQLGTISNPQTTTPAPPAILNTVSPGSTLSLDRALAVQPGDSSATVSAKVRAFALSTLLEILEEIPAPRNLAEPKTLTELKAAVKNIITATLQSSVTSGPEVSLSDSEIKLFQPHSFHSALKAGLFSEKLFQINNSDKFLQLLQQVKEQPTVSAAIARSIDAIQQLMASPSQENPSTEISTILNPVNAVAVRDILKSITQAIRSQPELAAHLTVPEWRLVIGLQDFLSENNKVLNAAVDDLKANQQTAASKSTPATAATKEGAAAFLKSAREIFFSPPGDIVVTPGAGSKDKIEPQGSNLTPSLRQEIFNVVTMAEIARQSVVSPTLSPTLSPAVNNLANQTVLNQLVSALASRLVVAHRLDTQNNRAVPAKRRCSTSLNKSGYRNNSSEAAPNVSWLLSFIVSGTTRNTVRVSNNPGAARTLTVELDENESRNAGATEEITASAKKICAQVGVNWIDWRVLKGPL